MLCVVLLSPWATYTQIAPLLTPVTIPALISGLILLTNLFLVRDLKVHHADFFLGSYIFVFSAGAIWGPKEGEWLNFVFWWILCFFVYLGIRQSLVTKKNLYQIMNANLIGLVITFFLLGEIEHDTFFMSTRSSVPGHNPNFTAYVLAGGFLLMFMSLRLFKLSRWIRGVVIAGLLLSVYIAVELGTRGALLSMASVLLISLFARHLPSAAIKFLIALIALMSLAVSFGIFDSLLMAIDLLSERSTGDLSGRGAIWKEAVDLIRAAPLLGYGPGASSNIGDLEVGAHNFFLVVLLDTGLLGMLVIGMFIAAFAKEILKSKAHGSQILMMFAAYWFPIATSGHWELAPFSWLVVAMTIQISKIAEAEIRKPTLTTFALSRPSKLPQELTASEANA